MPTLLLLAACASYEPFAEVDAALTSDDRVAVRDEGDFLLFDPLEPTTDVAVVFYPGGLVQHEAYAPPLRQLAEAGVVTALVPMPSDLAVLAPRKADRVLDEVAAGAWIVAGHSLGGAMAASYADRRREEVDGLALWAAYPPKGRDLSDSDLVALDLTASEDEVLDWDTWSDRQDLLPPATHAVTIDGGNHAGFAAYGPQDDDGTATIGRAEQHAQAVEHMLDLVRRVEDRGR